MFANEKQQNVTWSVHEEMALDGQVVEPLAVLSIFASMVPANSLHPSLSLTESI